MKINIILTLILLSNISLFGQVEFDIALRIGKSLVTSEDYSRSFNYTSRFQLDDTKYVENEVSGNSYYKIDFSKGNILELEGNVIFPVSNRLHIKTGFGLSYTEINFKERFIDSESTLISSDTIVGNINTGGGNPNFKPCEYQNSFTDVTLPNDRSSILSLFIPLEFEYDIIDKVSLCAGGYLQTPIVTNHSTHSIQSVTLEELTDVRLCKYALRTIKETNGGKFNDAVFGLSLGGLYRMTAHISAEIKYRYSLNNTYAENDSNIFSYSAVNPSYKNQSLLFGLSYKFGHHEHEKNVNEIE